MVLQIFPLPSTSSVTGKAYQVPLANTKYKLSDSFGSGVYTITCPTGKIATVTFDSGTSVTTAVTVSQTITVNLANDATSVYVSVDTGTDTVVSINQTATSLPGTTISGTLDTITSTNTYNQTGKLYVLAVGGGQGGGWAGWGGDYPSGIGGAYGKMTAGIVYTNTSTAITVGSAGTAKVDRNVGPNRHGNSGGASSFGNLLSAAGGGTNDNVGGGSNVGGSDGQSGSVQNSISLDITNGSNGGGGSGGSAYGNYAGPNTANGGSGGGSGIGTGGAGGNSPGPGNQSANAGGNATGYGAGGGGGASSGNGGQGDGRVTTGGAGSPGVVYVLRGF